MIVTNQAIGNKWELVFRLIRWKNLLIIMVSQYCTLVFLAHNGSRIPGVVLDPWFLMVCTGTVLVAAGGYIINDYYDIKIDYLNRPERVIVGKSLRRRTALIAHMGITLAGILLGFAAGWMIGISCLFAAFLLWFYSNLLKRLPFLGNFAIALLTALSIFIVWLYCRQNLGLILGYSIFGFFSTLIREVIKDMEDLKGDQTFGCKTIPILWGIRRTKSFVLAMILAFTVLFIVFISPFKILMLYFYLIFLAVPMIYFAWKLILADTRREFTQLSSLAKIIMVMGIGSMVFFK